MASEKSIKRICNYPGCYKEALKRYCEEHGDFAKRQKVMKKVYNMGKYGGC